MPIAGSLVGLKLSECLSMPLSVAVSDCAVLMSMCVCVTVRCELVCRLAACLYSQVCVCECVCLALYASDDS